MTLSSFSRSRGWKRYRESIYGEEEGSELDELSETVHMVLFLVMVLFLAQAIGLVALGNSIQKQWRLWETSSINKLPRRSIVGYVEDISRRPFAVNYVHS